MSKEQTTTQVFTKLAMSVAILIAGGYAIFSVGGYFPLPGIKYLLMAPYLSLIIAVVMKAIKIKYVVLKMSTVFALIMSVINIYMGLAIFLTGLCTQIVTMLLANFRYQVQVGAATYSSFSVCIALIVSRVFIGGPIFERISLCWIILAAFIAFIFGLIGSNLGNKIGNKVNKAMKQSNNQ
ncbi:MAG: hypothetical protein CVU84_13520 [Firmicutes bacterium HGW-Firmicutes-1]|jgi:energy-coupling factor transport system substrate-specific component|nr:MAG: hypothetical protein CVU84_13520 [Firmicutes bacterium HGW-Firmicutes-1]